jgi:hypothetical protein
MRTHVILATLLVVLLALPGALHAQATDPVAVTEGYVEAVNNGDVVAAEEIMAEDATVTVPQAMSGTEGESEEDTGPSPTDVRHVEGDLDIHHIEEGIPGEEEIEIEVEIEPEVPNVTNVDPEGDATNVDPEGDATNVDPEGDVTNVDPEGAELMPASPPDLAGTDPAAQQQYTGKAEIRAWLEGQAAANAQTSRGECTVEGETVTCDASYTSDTLQAKGVDVLEGELSVTVVDGKIQSYAFTPSPESVTRLQSAAMPATLPETGGTTQARIYLLLAVLGLLLLLAGVSVHTFQRRGV